MHEQRLHRVAHAGALRLRVEDDRLGHVAIGRLVDVDVTVPAGGGEHRDAGVLEQEVLQRLAATRDHDLRVRAVGDERSELLAAQIERDHDVDGQAGVFESCADRREQRAVGRPGRRRAAKERDVTRLQAQRGDVDRDVRSGLVDHEHPPDRDPHLRDLEAVRQAPPVDNLTTGIGQGRDPPYGAGERRKAVRVEAKAIDQRFRHASGPAALEVLLVCRQDRSGPLFDPAGNGEERRVLGVPRQRPQPSRRRLRPSGIDRCEGRHDRNPIAIRRRGSRRSSRSTPSCPRWRWSGS